MIFVTDYVSGLGISQKDSMILIDSLESSILNDFEISVVVNAS